MIKSKLIKGKAYEVWDTPENILGLFTESGDPIVRVVYFSHEKNGKFYFCRYKNINKNILIECYQSHAEPYDNFREIIDIENKN